MGSSAGGLTVSNAMLDRPDLFAAMVSQSGFHDALHSEFGAAGPAGVRAARDLEVGAMAVAATAEQPNRAGILIIAVTPGSVAQKSGIIVGDILIEFNGHPIRQPADLQAAVAAGNAGSAVPIKLYRGTEPISLTARF